MSNKRKVDGMRGVHESWSLMAALSGSARATRDTGELEVWPSVALLMRGMNTHNEIPAWAYVVGMYQGIETHDRTREPQVWAEVDTRACKVGLCFQAPATEKSTMFTMVARPETCEHAIVAGKIVITLGRVRAIHDGLGANQILADMYEHGALYSVALRTELATEPVVCNVSG